MVSVLSFLLGNYKCMYYDIHKVLLLTCVVEPAVEAMHKYSSRDSGCSFNPHSNFFSSNYILVL
jgi:hypothetical protein